MNRQLFTERMSQPQPRVKEFLDETVRSALFQIVQTRIESNAFGLSFPYQCPDGRGNAGGDEHALQRNMAGFQVVWPADASRLDDDQVTDAQIFDLLEYSYEHVANPVLGEFHSFYSHHHYQYDRPTGKASFANEVNRLFERNGIAFTLKVRQIELGNE